MTIEELEKKLTELNKERIKVQGQIKELKEKPIPLHPRCKPVQGYYYYCVEPNTDSPISFYYNGGSRTTFF